MPPTRPSTHTAGYGPVGRPARAKGARPILVAGLSTIVAASVGIVLVLVLGFQTRTPVETVDGFLQAIMDADRAKALEYRCAADVHATHEKWGGDRPPHDVVKEAEEYARGIRSYHVDEGSEHVSGDTASVDFSLTLVDGTVGDVDAGLVKEDDEWLICGALDVVTRDH